MTEILQPTIPNPGVIVPVNPAIEDYMRKLVDNTDHPVLLEMETLAKQKVFPLLIDWSAFFWKRRQK